ncbi:putative reverse transcriptase domain-containing protein [Tanacetum coccineum]
MSAKSFLQLPPAAPDGFAPQWIGGHDLNNNNGWIEEGDEEMEEEDDEEMEGEDDEEMEDEEEEEIVAEDEDEIIYPYDEADPNNRPPSASDDESEFAPSVILVFDAENRPVPPVIHFSSTYELGESSSALERSLRTSMRKLNEQIHERAEVDERIVKKIDRSDLFIRMVGRDAMSLDGAVREYQADVSKVISMMESMSLEFDRVRKESHRALELARNAAIADEDVEDDDVEDDDNMDDDAGNAGGPERAQSAKDCTFSSFMKIGECTKRNKVKFAAATLQGRALTWWNTQVATLSLAVANGKYWDDLKKTMLEEFCPEEEISRMKDDLRHLRLKDNDIAAYTNRFNELVLLCPDVVPTTKKKIGQYIKGLPSYIKGETYSSKPTTLNEAVRMAHGLIEHKIQG